MFTLKNCRSTQTQKIKFNNAILYSDCLHVD
jgi:hypothetical protein